MRESRAEKIFKLFQRLLFLQTESVCFPIFQGVQKYYEETLSNQQHENTWEDVKEEKKIHAHQNTQSDFLKSTRAERPRVFWTWKTSDCLFWTTSNEKVRKHAGVYHGYHGFTANRLLKQWLVTFSLHRQTNTPLTLTCYVIFQIWPWSKKAFSFDLCFDLVWCTFSAWNLSLIWGCQSEAFH